MPLYQPSTRPPAASPAEQLDRLRSTLDSLAFDLREGIARAFAQAAAGAVEQAFCALFGKSPSQRRWSYRHDSSSWSSRPQVR